MNDKDLIAAFLAKGGKVQVLEAGTSNGMTSKDWMKAVRGEYVPQTQVNEERYQEVLTQERFALGTKAANDMLSSPASMQRAIKG